MTTPPKDQAPEALRTHFEALASDPSFKLSRSRRGTYVNPAVARDWKWFQLGASCAQQPAPPDTTPMPEHWHVVVGVNCDNILCIGAGYLHGKRELSEAEENAIIGAAQHLLAFIGYGLPPSSFDPNSDDAPAEPAPGVSPGYVQGVEAVAKMIEKKADDFAQQYGSDDMGSLSFGRGAHADAKLDYHSSLVELADEARAMLAVAPQPQAAAGASTPARNGRWAWVPVEPSTAMLVAGNHGQPGEFSALKVWQDMLGALQRSSDYTHPIEPPPAAAQEPAEGVRKDANPEKCPITGRPYFMTLSHPELGMVPTYGGPYDSYTIPAPEGEPTDPWHERELRSERYDHDAGWWTEGGEPVPLRIIHEDVLSSLEERAEPNPPQPAVTAGAVDALDPIRALIAKHAAVVESGQNYAYFELAYTRRTGWMAWITDKPLAYVVESPDRKVLFTGQGETADEACADALADQRGGV